MKKTSAKKRLVLLDSHAIIHRAYHALPEFTTPTGEPAGALYGLGSMLMRIITDLSPDYIVACYDLPKPTFRHEAYAEYKGTRTKTDDALVAQIIQSRVLFNAFSIPMYDCEGFEADDLLGTIAHQLLNEKDLEIIIASGDMDTMQLVRDGGKNHSSVMVYTLKKGLNDTILYDEEAVKTRFGFMPEFLPDYKGLRGDTSDNIIGVKGIGEKTGTTLIAEYGTVEKLFTALKKDSDAVMSKTGITKRIAELLLANEEEALFSKTLATIRLDAPIVFTLPEPFLKTFEQGKVIALFERLGFKSLMNRIRSIGTSSSVGTEEQTKPIDPILLERARLALWVLDSTQTEADPESILYRAKATTLEAAIPVLEAEIHKNNLSFVYEKIEKPLAPYIAEMQRVGIKLDTIYLSQLSEQYHKTLKEKEAIIFGIAGKEININSPKQLGELLFDTMQISTKGLKKSASGARSTRESELLKLAPEHPIIGHILEYRELQKLLSTYIDVLPTLLGPDGRIHATFNQHGTTTGRFSSSDPNLQNIPIKSELGKAIRKAFVAEEGYVLFSLDYSQIELRVAALLAHDPYFIEVFNSGKDVHAAVAAKVFGVPESEVTYEMRRRAKVINFGIVYGMGVRALRENLSSTLAEAETFYQSYKAELPVLWKYLEEVKDFAYAHGYTETLFGRRRYFPELKSHLPFIRSSAERMAINAPLQGTAVDLVKLAIVAVMERVRTEGYTDTDVRLLLQVHDELVFEIRTELLEKVSPIIREEMENVLQKNKPESALIPLSVEGESGTSWGDI